VGAQSGWSLAHTASIYATLERGERVIECLDILLKGCTLNNLVTLHNDYRNMGVALNWRDFPIQMDANMGAVNAVQKMLLDERKGTLLLLPALPERLSKGSASGICFSKGKVSMKWDLEKHTFRTKIIFTRTGEMKVQLPKAFAESKITMTKGSYEVCGSYVLVHGEAGAEILISEF